MVLIDLALGEKGLDRCVHLSGVHLASVARPPRHSGGWRRRRGEGGPGGDQSLPGTLHTPVQAEPPACQQLVLFKEGFNFLCVFQKWKFTQKLFSWTSNLKFTSGWNIPQKTNKKMAWIPQIKNELEPFIDFYLNVQCHIQWISSVPSISKFIIHNFSSYKPIHFNLL